MKGVMFQKFAQPLTLEQLPDPIPPAKGVVIRVMATGLCRSDWHGWMGHDPDVHPPHVPGHEFAGVIEAVGKDVTKWQPGARVTLPFVCGCGSCPQCASGNHQVCDYQIQPGVTHWGAFAEYVAVDYAEVNLVGLPDSLDFVTAASLGCRFVTAFRAVVDQGKLSAGQWLAVHGCGGVGLSAIMIARALGARVVAVDIDDDKLDFAKRIGAEAVINASNVDANHVDISNVNASNFNAVADSIRDITAGGAHVSIDALGSTVTCVGSVNSLRKRGKHVQVGLMVADHRTPAVPMDRVIANELELIGSHGMQAHRYPALLAMIEAGTLKPNLLLGRTISLEEAMVELPSMKNFMGIGMTVIDRF